MIRFEIYDSDGRLDRCFRCLDGHFGYDIYMNMYDYLTRRFNLEHDPAENAVCWCELAPVGETYEANEFEIYVAEEQE